MIQMIANLMIAFTGLIGFLTIFVILLQYRSNRITNIYLVIIFTIVSTRMLLIGIFNLENNDFITTILTKYNNLLIVIVPCLYLYFKNLIKDYKKIELKNYVHFIIPLLFNIVDYLIDHNYFIINNIIYYYYIFFTIYSISYFVLMFFNLKNNIWNRKGEIGVVIKQNQLIKNWTIYFYTLLTVVAVRLIISLYIEISKQSYNFGTSSLWIPAIFWLMLFLKIIISPEILYGYSFLNSKINEQKESDNHTISFWINNPKNGIQNIQDRKLSEKIKFDITRYMALTDQYSFRTDAYRKTTFSLNDLSNKLNIPKSHLTFLFKYHSKISFSEYKKIIRIQDGLQLIESGYLSTSTYDSLAKEIGFKSYNTFFVSFKDVSGISPHDYLIQTLKNKRV
jgi:AraC-like DNA-binding protein